MKKRREMNQSIISKRIKTTFVTTVAMFLMFTQQIALAAGSNTGPFFGKKAAGKWIIGGKASKIDLNLPGIDDADAAGIVLGYEFATSIGDAGGSSTVEFEYITGDDTIADLDTSYDVDIANIFFTYRSAGTVYYKLKGGLSYTSFDINASGTTSDFEDTSASVGVGLGYRVGDLGVVELEYSADTGDADIGIFSLNALLEF